MSWWLWTELYGLLERPKPDIWRAKFTPSGQKWKHRHDTLLCDGELVGFADGDWRWMLPRAGKILRRLCFLAVSFSDNLSCLHSISQCDFLKTCFFFLQKYKSVMWTSYVQIGSSDHPAVLMFLNTLAFPYCSHFFSWKVLRCLPPGSVGAETEAHRFLSYFFSAFFLTFHQTTPADRKITFKTSERTHTHTRARTQLFSHTEQTCGQQGASIWGVAVSAQVINIHIQRSRSEFRLAHVKL